MERGFRDDLVEFMKRKGKEALVPLRVFVKGSYIGGAEEFSKIAEEGLLVRFLKDYPKKELGLCAKIVGMLDISHVFDAWKPQDCYGGERRNGSETRETVSIKMSGGSRPLLGDIIVIIATRCIAVSNVVEIFIRAKESRVGQVVCRNFLLLVQPPKMTHYIVHEHYIDVEPPILNRVKVFIYCIFGNVGLFVCYKEAHLVLSEDRRHSRRMLQHYNIKMI
ncbi:hypothetical protein FEM48_Zijuj05G0141800 [Ziziphus jujuba var. spinosa]|uniref:Uncharacterized protein n=1 Tax=Ziziphus jujuba var. spinosa TaxID=714518 RepID=A0A978VFA4_ZIZJJ|nr:hypothetical protein FEM48_Zijuj05G0141800 [Ziziphus jujuba var. spinosa]